MVREELEDKWRGNLVGNVRDADIKEGQLHFHEIRVNQLQFMDMIDARNALLQLYDHARVLLDGDDPARAFEKL